MSPGTSPSAGPRSTGGPRLLTVVTLVLTALALAVALTAFTALRTLGDVGVGASSDLEGDAVVAPARHTADDGYAVWDHNDDGAPVRWDPCSPVDLVVAPERAPVGAMADLERAVATVNRLTGLTLRITGQVDERPDADRPPYQPERYGDRWAPVLVAWASPHENDVPLRDTDRGVAIPVAVGPSGDRTYVTGQVVFNADRNDLVSGYADRAGSWGATLLHEFAHVVGLAHVDDPDELLHVYPGAGPVRFSAGDRAGLAAVGAQHGCRDVPDARPVRVAAPAG